MATPLEKDSYLLYYSLSTLGLLFQPLHKIFWRDEDLGVLFQESGKVLEEGMLGPQEVKLVIPLLPIHKCGEELTTITGHKLGCQSHLKIAICPCYFGNASYLISTD